MHNVQCLQNRRQRKQFERCSAVRIHYSESRFQNWFFQIDNWSNVAFDTRWNEIRCYRNSFGQIPCLRIRWRTVGNFTLFSRIISMLKKNHWKWSSIGSINYKLFLVFIFFMRQALLVCFINFFFIY